DVLAEQVVDVRPEALAQVVAVAGVRQRAQVVDECVYPDIGDLLLVPGDRHAPRLARAADAEVRQTARDEAPSLVVPEPWQDKIRPLVVEREQALLVRRQPEEVVLLLDVLGRGAVLGAEAVDEIGLVLELLAADAVEPRVDVLVDVAVVVDALEELLDEALVPLVGRADEEVVLSIDTPRQLAPVVGDAVDVLLWVEPLLLGDSEHLGRVLVCTREEEGLVAALAVMPDDYVGRDGRVRVADVRRRV